MASLALPTAVSAGMDSLKYNKEADNNGQIPFPAFPSTYGARTFAAGVLTHSRCAATQGYMTGKEAVLNAQNTMYKNGYSIKILDEILKNMSLNKKRMLELASSGYITATDLADYLVKNHSMSFRKAYEKTAAIVNFAEKNKKKLNELTLEEFKKIEPKLDHNV